MKTRICILLFLLLIIFIANAFVNPIPHRTAVSNFRPAYGVSYNFEQAVWLGLDGKKSFIDLISTYKFDWIRLPFFWDQMVDENGKLKIENLKFAVEEAGKRNIKIVIALGAKTPYFPEYHWPEGIRQKIKFGETIDIKHPVAGDILEIDKRVVQELSSYKNISHWQIENEPLLANINNWKIDKSLIEAEVKVVRENDPYRRPIILNHIGPAVFDRRWKSLIEILRPGDVLGVNAYFKTQGVQLFSFKFLGREVNIGWPKWLVWPVQSWLFLSPDFGGVKKEVEARGIEFWVLEVQAEPYVRTLGDAQKNNFFYNPLDIGRVDNFLRSYGVKSVGFWEADFWLYKAYNGDNSWLEAIGKITN